MPEILKQSAEEKINCIRFIPFMLKDPKQDNIQDEKWNYCFTKVLLNRKTSKAIEPNQILPIWCKREKWIKPEKLIANVIDIAREETWLWIMRLFWDKDAPVEHYGFLWLDWKIIHNSAKFFAWELQYDHEPFPINAERSRTKFIYLDKSQFENLLNNWNIEYEWEPLSLLSDIHLSSRARSDKWVRANTANIRDIHWYLSNNIKLYESEIKKDLMILFCKHYWQWVFESEERIQKIVEIKSLSLNDANKVEEYFNKFVKHYEISESEIKDVLKRLRVFRYAMPSEIEGKKETNYEALSRTAKLFTWKWTDKEELLAILKANPQVRTWFRKIRHLLRDVFNGSEINKQENSKKNKNHLQFWRARLDRSAKTLKDPYKELLSLLWLNIQCWDIGVDDLERYLFEVLWNEWEIQWIDNRPKQRRKLSSDLARLLQKEYWSEQKSVARKDFFDAAQISGSLISWIAKTYLSKKIWKKYKLELINSLNEIDSVQDILLLVWLSLWQNIPSNYHWKNKKQIRGRLVFEARRKLTLIILALEVKKTINEKKEWKTDKIDKLFHKIFTAPIKTKVLTHKKTRERIIIDEDKEINWEYDYHVNIRESRQIKWIKDSDFYWDHREKDPESFVRKILTRWESPHTFDDLFWRAIIADSSNPDMIKRIKQKVVFYKTEWEGLIKVEKEIEDHWIVFEIMDRIMKINPNAVFLDYKPTSKEWEGLQSNWWWWWAELYYAKIYVRIWSETEEIMIFPTTKNKEWKIVSWLKHFKDKKKDDERYAFDRLLEPWWYMHRSVIDLLFPPSIYWNPIHKLREDRSNWKKYEY